MATLRRSENSRRELQRLNEWCQIICRPSLVSNFTTQHEGKCTWFYGGNVIQVGTRRELNEYLSTICDNVYHKAPIIRNELINQRRLSHSASRARRMLIKAMLESANQASLGIDGYPPQLSVYLSLLSDTGIHRNESGEWGFPPAKIR